MITPASSAASRSVTDSPRIGQRVQDPQQIAIGVGGSDDQRRPGRRRQPLEQQVDDALAARSDRHRVGQVGPSLALVGVEQVGGLDEHERNATAGGDELAARHRAAHAGIAQDPVGDVVGDRVELDHRTGVERLVGHHAARRDDADPVELQAAGDERQRPPRGDVDPAHVVDEHHDRPFLRGVDEEVSCRQGHGERLDRFGAALDRQRGAKRRRTCRGELVEPAQQAVEQAAEA